MAPTLRTRLIRVASGLAAGSAERRSVIALLGRHIHGGRNDPGDTHNWLLNHRGFFVMKMGRHGEYTWSTRDLHLVFMLNRSRGAVLRPIEEQDIGYPETLEDAAKAAKKHWGRGL